MLIFQLQQNSVQFTINQRMAPINEFCSLSRSRLTETKLDVFHFQGLSWEKVDDIFLTKNPPAIKSIYEKPLLLHQGHMQWLYDHEGRRYLDLLGGILTVSVGHCHRQAFTQFIVYVHFLLTRTLMLFKFGETLMQNGYPESKDIVPSMILPYSTYEIESSKL